MAQQRALTLLFITLSSAVLYSSAPPAAVASPSHTGLQDISATHYDQGHASPEAKHTSQPRLHACGWPVVPPSGSPKQQRTSAIEHPSMPPMPPVGGGMISVNLPVPPVPAPHYRRRHSDTQTPPIWTPERMPDAILLASLMPRPPSSPTSPPCNQPSHAPIHPHAPETPSIAIPRHVHPAGEAASTLAGHAQDKGPQESPSQSAERQKRPPLVIPTPDEFSWERRAAAGLGEGGPGSGADGQGMPGATGPGAAPSGLRGEGIPHAGMPGGMTGEDAPAGDGAQAQQQDTEEDRRINLAAAADGASVVGANKEAKKPEKTIDGDDDSYMKNHCPAHKWLILELSQLGRVDEVELVNKEMYSSRVKDFTVKGRQSHPRKDGPASEFPRWFDTDTWHLLGHFTAANKKGDQMFRMQIPRRVRYILFQFHTHYGNEEMCALNSISVLGVSAAQELEEALAAHLDKHVHTTTTGGRTHPGAGSTATGSHQGTPPTPGAATVPPPPVVETAHGATGVAATGMPEAAASPQESGAGVGGRTPPTGASSSVQPSTSPPRTCMCEPGGAFLRPYTLTCARVCAKPSHGASNNNDVVTGASTAPQEEEDEYLDDDSTEEDYDASVTGELVEDGDTVLLPEPTPSLTEPLVAGGSPAAGGRVTKATTGSTGSLTGAQLSTVPGAPATPDSACDSHGKGHHPMPSTGQHTECLDREEQAVESISGRSQRPSLQDEPGPATISKAGGTAEGPLPPKPPPDLVLPPPHPVLPPPDAHRSGTAIIPPIPAPGLASDSHQTVASQPSTPPPGVGAPSPQPAPSTQCTMPPPQPASELNAAVRKGDHHPHPSVPIDRPPTQPSTPSAGQPPTTAHPDPPRPPSESVPGVVSAGPGPGLLAEGGVWEQAGRMVLVPPPELPKSVVDGLLTSMEGGPAAKPKQAGNLFDIFKQEFVLLRLNQSRTWRYMTSLVEVLNKHAAEATGELDAVEAAVAALELRLTTLPAQVEATVSRHLSRKYDQQLMRLTARMDALQHEVALGRQREWALLLYCSAVLAVVLAYSMHQSKAGSVGGAARIFSRLVLLLGVFNGLIGLTLHSPQLQQTLMLLLGLTSHAGSGN